MKRFVLCGAIFGFLSVALGAFGAHVLKDLLTERMLANFQTGVQYQMYHALALILTGLCLERAGDNNNLVRAGWCFAAGIVLFSGSLYVLSLSGVLWLGAITPFGGVAFLAGWAFLGVFALRKA